MSTGTMPGVAAYNTLRDRDAQGKIIVDLAGAARGEKVLDTLEGT
jgi:hypothetical protein